MNTQRQPQSERELAAYLANLADKTGRTRTEIATQCGFRRPNILSMILNGQTRLPLDKIHSFAQVVEVDPNQLSLLCLSVYEPTIFKLLKGIFDAKDSVTESEWKVVHAIRESYPQH